MDPLLNKGDDDYDPEDPGTWYTMRQWAHDLRCEGSYRKSAKIYYDLAIVCGNPDVYSWLMSTGINIEEERKK